MARMIKSFQEFTNLKPNGEQNSTPNMNGRIYNEKSRTQIWNEFNHKYAQLYGKDLFGNSPHPKAKHVKSKETKVITTDSSDRHKRIASKLENSDTLKNWEDKESIAQNKSSFFDKVSTLQRKVLFFPFNAIWFIFGRIYLFFSSNKEKKKESSGTKTACNKHSYSGSYNK